MDSLLLPHYFNAKQDADTIGSPIIVDFETKGKVFSALYANAQNALSFLFFTDPHISNIGEEFFDSYMTMMKKRNILHWAIRTCLCTRRYDICTFSVAWHN